MLKRVVMWLEAIVAVLFGGGAVFCGSLFLNHGHEDRHHGGMYVLLAAGFLLAGAAAFALGAAGLRRKSSWGWAAQIFPAALVGWLLWDVLSHR